MLMGVAAKWFTEVYKKKKLFFIDEENSRDR